MSNNTKLHDREYIVSLCVLNAFFALTAVVLNSVTIHAIRKTSTASLPKNLRALLLNLAFSDLSVGLVVQPFYTIHLTFSFESQERDNSQMNTLAFVTGVVCVSASILGVLALSVDRSLAVYLHLRYQASCFHLDLKLGDKYNCFPFLDRARIQLLPLDFPKCFVSYLPHNNSITSL